MMQARIETRRPALAAHVYQAEDPLKQRPRLNLRRVLDTILFYYCCTKRCPQNSFLPEVLVARIRAMAEVAYRTNASRIADEERDVRVEDYLNDKLQNNTDLANIDSLLEDVKAQQVLLQQQVFPLTYSSSPMPTLTSLSYKRPRQFSMRPQKHPLRTRTISTNVPDSSSRSKMT